MVFRRNYHQKLTIIINTLSKLLNIKPKYIIVFIFTSFLICPNSYSSELQEYTEFEEDIYETEDEEDFIYDPLEPMNRIILSFNNVFDKNFFRPLAVAYRKFVPMWTQYIIGNAVNTFFAPVRFINFSLQGDIENAAKTIARFMFNFVFGFFGTCDVAKVVGLTPTKNTNFGDTLKKWGAGPGPYIVLPFIGPTSFRGGIGMFFDQGPFSYANEVPIRRFKKLYRKRIKYTALGVDMLLTRVSLLDIMDDLEKMPLDQYILTRSASMEREK